MQDVNKILEKTTKWTGEEVARVWIYYAVNELIHKDKSIADFEAEQGGPTIAERVRTLSPKNSADYSNYINLYYWIRDAWIETVQRSWLYDRQISDAKSQLKEYANGQIINFYKNQENIKQFNNLDLIEINENAPYELLDLIEYEGMEGQFFGDIVELFHQAKFLLYNYAIIDSVADTWKLPEDVKSYFGTKRNYVEMPLKKIHYIFIDLYRLVFEEEQLNKMYEGIKELMEAHNINYDPQIINSDQIEKILRPSKEELKQIQTFFKTFKKETETVERFKLSDYGDVWKIKNLIKSNIRITGMPI